MPDITFGQALGACGVFWVLVFIALKFERRER